MKNRTQPVERVERIAAIKEALQAREQQAGLQEATLFICHCHPYCDIPESDQQSSCKWCHQVPPGDRRTAEQIELDILIQQRGH